jgi:transcriptional regulator CtsR
VTKSRNKQADSQQYTSKRGYDTSTRSRGGYRTVKKGLENEREEEMETDAATANRHELGRDGCSEDSRGLSLQSLVTRREQELSKPVLRDFG